ncbi:MAG: uracil-DNA glycosylase family protein [Bacteroidetes bacterium]|nr:uracil-DNA glycosylase family protein [Bacteroidota bacterium]
MKEANSLEELLIQIRSCRICEAHLPFEPRPVLSASVHAGIAIIGQAPGTKVHESGIPWNDKSGELLRIWLDVTPETFYDNSRFAITPMGFCYPGKGKSGDLPPRPECSSHWQSTLFEFLPNVKLLLLIGQYAQNFYLGNQKEKTLTETVRNYEKYLPRYFPLPHPSPRNRLWLRKNPWFEDELIPVLRTEIRRHISI